MVSTGDLVLVTGAAGTLGRYLVYRLRATGCGVRALVRRHDMRTAQLQAAGAEVVAGDMRSRPDLAAAIAGVTDVIAAAGVAIPKGDNTPMAVDYKGNCTLIDLALGEKVRHFVLISVIGADFLEYSSLFRAKRWAEQYLKGSGLRHTILRPGGFMSDWQTAWERYGRRGLYPALGAPDKSLALVSPGDLAAVAVKALRTPGNTSRTYTVTNGEDLSPRDVATLYSRLFDEEVRLLAIPVLPAKAIWWPLRLVAPNAADFLGLLLAFGEVEFNANSTALASDFDVSFKTYEAFLRETMPGHAQRITQ